MLLLKRSVVVVSDDNDLMLHQSLVWSPAGLVGCLDKHLAGRLCLCLNVLNGPDMPIKYQLCAPNTRP